MVSKGDDGEKVSCRICGLFEVHYGVLLTVQPTIYFGILHSMQMLSAFVMVVLT